MSDWNKPGRLLSSMSGIFPLVAVFVTANAFDWLLTWTLVTHGDGYEANPIAARILQNHGWTGLACLKAASVAVVLGVVLSLYQRYRRAARRLLYFACAVMLLVVGYSSVLITKVGGDDSIMAREKSRELRIVGQRRWYRGYLEKVDELAREIAAGRLELFDATAELSAYLGPSGQDPTMVFVQVCRGLDRKGRLSAHLVRETGFVVRNEPDTAQRVLPRLRQRFISSYSFIPEFARYWFPGEAGHRSMESPGY